MFTLRCIYYHAKGWMQISRERRGGMYILVVKKGGHLALTKVHLQMLTGSKAIPTDTAIHRDP